MENEEERVGGGCKTVNVGQ